MRRTATLPLSLTLLLPLAAHAAPIQLAWQGRLLDAAGAPIHGPQPVVIRLWSAASGGTALHVEDLGTVPVADGYLAATLGAAGDLDASDLSAGAAWVEVTVDGTALLPRQRLADVPFAAGGGAALGASPRTAGRSCYALKQADPELPSGVYWLDLTAGTPSDAFQAYCEMAHDGGGWTLVMQARPVAYTDASLCTEAAVGALTLDDAGVIGPAKLSHDAINALFADGPEREVLYKGDALNWNGVAPFGVWEAACQIDLRDDYALHLGQHVVGDLESPTVTCAGASSFDVLTVGTNGTGTCGWQFQNNTLARYVIFSATTTYTSAPCTGTTAGRSWPGLGPDQGCHTSKMFVR